MLDYDQQVRFTRLWTAAQPTFSQFVASLVRDQWAVRDIVQNTSQALLNKFSEYDDARPFLPRALGVAKFEILGYRRDVSRSQIVSNSNLLERYAQTWAELAPRLSEEASTTPFALTGIRLTGAGIAPAVLAAEPPTTPQTLAPP